MDRSVPTGSPFSAALVASGWLPPFMDGADVITHVSRAGGILYLYTEPYVLQRAFALPVTYTNVDTVVLSDGKVESEDIMRTAVGQRGNHGRSVVVSQVHVVFSGYGTSRVLAPTATEVMHGASTSDSAYSSTLVLW